MKLERAPIRLAFRAEGEFWNAYAARNDTMTDAVLLGSIRLGAVRDENQKAQFRALMQDVLALVVKDITGRTMVFSDTAEPVPEHERAARA